MKKYLPFILISLTTSTAVQATNLKISCYHDDKYKHSSYTDIEVDLFNDEIIVSNHLLSRGESYSYKITKKYSDPERNAEKYHAMFDGDVFQNYYTIDKNDNGSYLFYQAQVEEGNLNHASYDYCKKK
ncbi:hypothetical protein AB4380_00705 [Vibrio breoganii]